MRESRDLMGVRILIVDDSFQIISLLADGLYEHGALVAAAQTGGSAIKLLRERDFDIVLLDLMMTSPNVLEVLAWIKGNKPSLACRTILLKGDQFHPQTARSVGEARMQTLFKPFTIADILDKVYDMAREMDVCMAG